MFLSLSLRDHSCLSTASKQHQIICQTSKKTKHNFRTSDMRLVSVSRCMNWSVLVFQYICNSNAEEALPWRHLAGCRCPRPRLHSRSRLCATCHVWSTHEKSPRALAGWERVWGCVCVCPKSALMLIECQFLYRYCVYAHVCVRMRLGVFLLCLLFFCMRQFTISSPLFHSLLVTAHLN